MPASGTRLLRARLVPAIAATALVALGAAYYFTYEPAPEVSITWREGTTWMRRSQIERQFGLVRGRDIADWRVWYDLVDVRASNIAAMERQPEIAAIDGLDLEADAVPPDGPYGDGWMWIGPRIPVLRHRGVVPGVILLCTAVLVLALPRALGAAWQWPGLTRTQVLATAVLAAIAGAWYVTYERAPGMSVRWRDGVTEDRRGSLERAFRLARGRAPEGRTITYDLLDVRPSNVQALVEHPLVEDTGYVDRARRVVPANAPFGQGGMWIGTRVPVLRTYGLVGALAAVCGILIVYPVLSAAWRARRARAAAPVG